jgi:hypothetical protein
VPDNEKPKSEKKETTPLRLEKTLCDEAKQLADVIMPGLPVTRFVERALYEFIDLVHQNPGARKVPDLVKKLDLLRSQGKQVDLPESSLVEEKAKDRVEKILSYSVGAAVAGGPSELNEHTALNEPKQPASPRVKDPSTSGGKKDPHR